jgi:hypothetical protein
VSLKHNSRFASFTLVAKGDYPAELNIPIPFALVSNDVTENKLVVMPAYWFLYNMYALARNAAKYVDRDKRTEKIQHIEYDYLAPDSINEIFTALHVLAQSTALAFDPALKTAAGDVLIKKGNTILNGNEPIDDLQILVQGFENSSRPVQLIKVKEAYGVFKKLVVYYGITELVRHIQAHSINTFSDLLQSLPQQPVRNEWLNVGGQLVPQYAVHKLLDNIKNGTVKSWDTLHETYVSYGDQYPEQKQHHAFASLLEITGTDATSFTLPLFKQLVQEAIETKVWMFENIYKSRAKDYQSPFRKMMYNTDAELEQVIGKLEDNAFIKSQQQELETFQQQMQHLIQNFSN